MGHTMPPTMTLTCDLLPRSLSHPSSVPPHSHSETDPDSVDAHHECWFVAHDHPSHAVLVALALTHTQALLAWSHIQRSYHTLGFLLPLPIARTSHSAHHHYSMESQVVDADADGTGGCL